MWDGLERILLNWLRNRLALAIPANDHDAHVVLLFASDDVLFDGLDEFVTRRLYAPPCILDDLSNTVDRELFTSLVGGFENAVGVHSKALAGFEGYLEGVKLYVGHDAQRRPGDILSWFADRSIGVEMDRGHMAGDDDRRLIGCFVENNHRHGDKSLGLECGDAIVELCHGFAGR